MTTVSLEGVRKARAGYLRYRVPRRWKVHKGPLAAAYRAHYVALRETYGPLDSELERQACADAAEAFVRKLVASRTWQEAVEKRTTGTGRRPNQTLIIRLSKRCALDASTYDLAVNKLQALTGAQGRPPAQRERAAVKKAGVPGRIPHDFRRTAVRNLERAGVSRSAAMRMVGHKTESIYRRYAVTSEGDLLQAGTQLAALHTEDRQPRAKVVPLR